MTGRFANARPTAPASVRPFRIAGTPLPTAVLATALLLVLWVPGLLPAHVPMALAPHPRAGFSESPSLGLPVGHRSLPIAAGPRPLASNEFYTQIGATLSEINNTFSVGGLTHLSERIPLVVSPYPIGYELNLLSDTGDWYQVVVGDNWPGCSAGFEEIIEVWDAAGGSGPVTCDPAVSLSKGNLVELNASFPNTSTACLGLNDLTTKHLHVVCQSQPDAGGSQYVFLSTAANGNGYYTGTMTEIVNLSATKCPNYRLIPTVTFDFPVWAHITDFVPWSDEWNNVPSGTFCYSNQGPPIYMPGPTPQSHYADSTGGSSDGPQEVQGQNDTLLNLSVGFRFQSDPKPITAENLTTTGITFAPGGGVTLNSSTVGGIGPYQTLWEFDGGFGSGHLGSAWNFSTFTPGNYTFQAFGFDTQGDALGSPIVTVRVPFPLKATALVASTGSGADVGEAVNFTSRVSGGLAPLSYAWSGLPSGCVAWDRPWIACGPNAPGSSSIVLFVTDSNGSRAQSPPLAFTVSPSLAVGLSGNRTLGDVGQTAQFHAGITGGSGGLTFAWSDLPTGCTSLGAYANCSLGSTGQFVVTVTVTDSNHVALTPGSSVLIVSPSLSVALTGSATVIDVGRLVTLASAVHGGSGGLRFTWQGLPAGCAAANTATIHCSPTNASSGPIGLSVTDRANATIVAPPVSLTVYPALSVALSANRTDAVAPAALSITPMVVGGSNLVNISWGTIPAGCSTSGLRPVTCTGLTVGNYTISLRVDDIGHGNASASLRFSVGALPPPAPNPPPGLSFGGFSLATLSMLALVVLLVAGAAVGVRRRRGPPARP
ncbi:MAG TPA: hypothetical protein VGX00_06340 [Thermoplasmata archaeon]|nr:hypothetical protein [Thermoplasmata archaeon]